MPTESLFLLVEDNADDILLVQRAFMKANISNPLHVVRSCEEAIQYLSGEGAYATLPLPSVILLDLKLAGRNGFEVLEWIRRQPSLHNLRVIVLTSSDSVYDVDRAYKLGANSFLIKPVHFERLVEIMSAIRGYWVWHDSAPSVSRPKCAPRTDGHSQNQPAPGSPSLPADAVLKSDG